MWILADTLELGKPSRQKRYNDLATYFWRWVMVTFEEAYRLLKSNIEEMERRAREIKGIACLISTVERSPSRRHQARLDRLGDAGPVMAPLGDAVFDLGERSGYSEIVGGNSWT